MVGPFTAVKKLYMCKRFAPRIAPALQEFIKGRTTEVFPALQNHVLLEFHPLEPVHEGITQFISMRGLSNHPVTIYVWNRYSQGQLYSMEDMQDADELMRHAEMLLDNHRAIMRHDERIFSENRMIA